MSIEVSKLAWQAALTTGSDKLVLLALSDFANDAGEAWPSIATLSRMCSRGETAVREALHRLTNAGHLTRRDRIGKTPMFIVHPRVTPLDFRRGSGLGRGSEIDTPTPPDIRTPPLYCAAIRMRQ